jgi:hypothetical protein
MILYLVKEKNFVVKLLKIEQSMPGHKSTFWIRKPVAKFYLKMLTSDFGVTFWV